MVVASFGHCPRCHEQRRASKVSTDSFICLLEYEGKVIIFRPVLHHHSISPPFPLLTARVRFIFVIAFI